MIQKLRPGEIKKKRLERQRRYNRTASLKKYNLTTAIFQQMLANQNNACAICFDPFLESKFTHLDHDHATGLVRAILCNKCNVGLGSFMDNKFILLRAVNYLQWYEDWQNKR